ncbi:hypothetical protein EV360DRAFT_69393 [Lentinula raphanica]|nr:hypothetical protein EV360DRAFT_69393 [Lentinula raphanica]
MSSLHRSRHIIKGRTTRDKVNITDIKGNLQISHLSLKRDTTALSSSSGDFLKRVISHATIVDFVSIGNGNPGFVSALESLFALRLYISTLRNLDSVECWRRSIGDVRVLKLDIEGCFDNNLFTRGSFHLSCAKGFKNALWEIRLRRTIPRATDRELMITPPPTSTQVTAFCVLSPDADIELTSNHAGRPRGMDELNQDSWAQQ